MATETQIQIVREAPDIEAYKLGLLGDAKTLVGKPITLPIQQIAAMSGLQDKAIAAASPATGGIGGYQPYLQEAGYTMGDAYSPISGAQAAAQPFFQQAGTDFAGVQGAAQPGLSAAQQGITGAQIARYMNPYQQAVQAEIDRSFDMQAAQAGLGAVGAGAFGGSRAAVQQSEIGRNRAAALAQAQAQNFLQAQQAAAQQLDRGMAAGMSQAQLGLQTGAARQGLGQAQAQLGLQTGEALGTLGLRQASLGELAQKQALMDIETQFNLGKQQQARQQAEIEAKRQSDLAQLYEPYQRYGFLSDIYKGAPTSQQSLISATAPNVSPAQQYLGLGIAGLSAAAGAQKAGLFG